MKKIIIVVLSVLAVSFAASAQPRAIGIRAGWGGELSYQHYMGGENFLEADLGFVGGSGSSGFYLTGIYDWVFASSGNFNFYAGPGLQLGAYAYNDGDNGTHTAAQIAVVGQLGAEFVIPGAPINISLDWRPAFYLLNSGSFSASGFALGLRYRF